MQIIEEDEINNNIENSVISTIDSEYKEIFKPKILVFGVGGGGVNAVDNMVGSELDNLENVKFVVANTDYQHLENSRVKNKILLGKRKNRGSGAGMNPEEGKTAAEESMDEIESYLKEYKDNMIFITAGMGGGTGTGAAPVIAKKARELDILVAAIVTTPFENEGRVRMEIAQKGIQELKENSDTLIIVPNQNLFRLEKGITFTESMKMIDKILMSGIKGIVEMIMKRGLVNLDFADVKTIMKKIGKAMMGTGEASGENRAVRAVEEAISNPLLDDTSIRGAKGIIINITGPTDMTLLEFDAATKRIKEEIDNEYANIILGNVIDETLVDTIRVSIFATGIDEKEDNKKNNYEKEYGEEEYKDYNLIENTKNSQRHEMFLKKEHMNTSREREYYYDDKNDNYPAPPHMLKHNLNNNNIKKRKFDSYSASDYEKENESFFDMGNSVKYDEYGKNNKQTEQYLVNNFQKKEIPNNDYDVKQKTIKQEKKSGFFGNLFGNKKNENINVVKIEDDDEDDYDNLNISFYKTPTYLRNKDKKN